MSENNNKQGSRLPPPAFPPGSRKQQTHRNSSAPKAEAAPKLPAGDSAYISPDDPMPERRPDAMSGAFISPEDPMPKREALGVRRTMGKPEEGVVTGLGSNAHVDKGELAAAGDPHVMELTEAVGKLAQALKRKGESGLSSSPDMSRFDATLRAYCVGFLAGRRAEAQPELLDCALYPVSRGSSG
ncbi:MAG: hypothetical protein EXR91_07595 [Gemmatimonadetes bacterium]|nr:hypothetical protein [Gemmatimonadota bacterium]